MGANLSHTVAGLEREPRNDWLMRASGGLKDFWRDRTQKAASFFFFFISSSSSSAAAYARMLYGDMADPSYIIDVSVSMEPRMLRGWCRAETMRGISLTMFSPAPTLSADLQGRRLH